MWTDQKFITKTVITLSTPKDKNKFHSIGLFKKIEETKKLWKKYINYVKKNKRKTQQKHIKMAACKNVITQLEQIYIFCSLIQHPVGLLPLLTKSNSRVSRDISLPQKHTINSFIVDHLIGIINTLFKIVIHTAAYSLLNSIINYQCFLYVWQTRK
jgi:hypothetical protein